jgi:hypothetical protein
VISGELVAKNAKFYSHIETDVRMKGDQKSSLELSALLSYKFKEKFKFTWHLSE